MDNKLDKIFHLFRNLDTPREREVHNFIEQNGGVEQCVIKDELLIKLLSQTGDFSTSGKTGVVKGQELVEIRESLRAELSEDLDEVLARNLSRFEKLLKVQNNNLKSILDHIEHQGYEILNHTTKLDKIVTTTISILEEEHHMRKAIAPILSINFKDPVLQSIWNRMGLKGSVKAKTFVLTFRDHIFADSSDPASSFASPVGQSLYTPYSDDGHSFNNNTPTFSPFELSSDILQSEIEDQWVLQYVNVGHVQPVVEAIDEDGSGFISVKEANKFAISRPKGWSFLRWIAYWAEGWHINITNYRSKLYSIVQQMHNALLSAHPANRSYVDEYLNHPSFNRLEALLRSITPLPDNAHIDSKLTEIADSMTSLLERRLVLNLTEMSYILESPATVSLVAGTGRIETWILSLLYLVLSRHLEIITLAQKYVLHEKELGSHVKSLASIFSLFDDRIHHLESIFRTHAQQDLSAQFEKFAYGMFLAPFANREKNPSENTLLTFKDNKASLNQISERPNVKAAGGIIAIGTSILTMGLGPSFEFEDIDMDSSPAPEGHTPHPLEGVWTGQCIRTNNKQIAFQGFFHCAIDPVVDGTITGHGETYLGAVEFNGEVEADEDAEGVFLNVDFRIISENYADLWCRGQYDPKTEAISGQWVIDDDSGDFPPDDNDAEEKHMDLRLPCGRFYMTRTPASVFRFRDLLDGNGAESAYNMARKRWSFAIEAIRFQTQERLRSWSFLRARTAERRKWIELTIRRELDKISLGAKAQLSEEGKDELWALRLQMHPTNGRLYDSLSMYLFKRMSFNVGPYNCDSCDRRIIFGRYQCITCMDDKLSSQIDLCADCIEKPQLSAETSFAHHISHSLIRSTHRIHECQLASMIPQARSRSERIKASFRALEGKESKMVIGLMAHWDDKAIPLSTPPKCACCNQTVSFPCWVCVACGASR
ncbi:hypothetical protein BDZ97DRAFT_1407102 [Flammula alnicola]|nr:hypothetical protein BDZ97DRAFT_1407102 [Flammula alnicola]